MRKIIFLAAGFLFALIALVIYLEGKGKVLYSEATSPIGTFLAVVICAFAFLSSVCFISAAIVETGSQNRNEKRRTPHK
jgi:hypothetical protein